MEFDGQSEIPESGIKEAVMSTADHSSDHRTVIYLQRDRGIFEMTAESAGAGHTEQKTRIVKVIKSQGSTHTDNSDKGNSSRGTDVPKLGLTVAPANSVAGAGKEGVVVTEVDPKSAAAERGFKEGDVILEVAGKSVGTAGEVRDAITTARSDNKNSVLMRVKSGGSSRFVAVPLAKG